MKNNYNFYDQNLYLSEDGLQNFYEAEHKYAGIWYFTDHTKLEQAIKATNGEGWAIHSFRDIWFNIPRAYTNPSREKILEAINEQKYFFGTFGD